MSVDLLQKYDSYVIRFEHFLMLFLLLCQKFKHYFFKEINRKQSTKQTALINETHLSALRTWINNFNHKRKSFKHFRGISVQISLHAYRWTGGKAFVLLHKGPTQVKRVPQYSQKKKPTHQSTENITSHPIIKVPFLLTRNVVNVSSGRTRLFNSKM